MSVDDFEIIIMSGLAIRTLSVDTIGTGISDEPNMLVPPHVDIASVSYTHLTLPTKRIV